MQKYIKYKNKYLALKKQIGSGTEIENIKTNKYINLQLLDLKKLGSPSNFKKGEK